MSDASPAAPSVAPSAERSLRQRHLVNQGFVVFCVITAFLSVVVLLSLIIAILVLGLPTLNFNFVTSPASDVPAETGISAALMGSLWVCAICGLSALPIGVATAIFLEEFRPSHIVMRWLHAIVQLNLTNLAGVPSVVYGVLGLTAFVALFGIFGANPNEPAVEFGLTRFDQFGTADSNLKTLIRIPVRGDYRAPMTKVTEGMEALTEEGWKPLTLIGPWEPLPEDDALVKSTLRTGSLPIRKEIDGKFYDEFETASGDVVRFPVESRSAPPTEVKRGMRALPREEGGDPLRVIVIGSDEMPDITLKADSEPERISDDGKHFDEFRTADDVAIRIPVKPSAPPTELVEGREWIGVTAAGIQVEISVSSSGLRSKYQSNLDVMLRTDPTGGRVEVPSWYYVRLPFGRSVLAGGLTLMLVILPVVIIASQEALRAVPDSLREGAYGMGATPWQVVWNVTLPASIPGIMTGSILAMSRAIGEAAPILIICGIVLVPSGPQNLMDDFTVMPLQIYNWVSRPQKEFIYIAASGIIVLLTMLLSFNALAIYVRHKLQKPLS